MSKLAGRIIIEISFSDELVKTVKKAVSNGERTSVQAVIDSLVGIYRKTINDTPQFTRPLKTLDKHFKIKVSGGVAT